MSKTPTELEYDSALALIKERRDRYEKDLKNASEGECQGPVMVEGETTSGYFCQLMVDPKEAAKIMLRWNYPLYRALQEDAPDEMWEELGRLFGLDSVVSIDL